MKVINSLHSTILYFLGTIILHNNVLSTAFQFNDGFNLKKLNMQAIFNPLPHSVSRHNHETRKTELSRRIVFGRAALIAIVGSTTGTFITTSGAGAATDDVLFKKNPLLNPILEQIRIWEQAEADNIRYGGELERGDAGNMGKVDAYPKLLVPILQMAYELERINQLVQNRDGYSEANSLLQQERYQKIPFKRVFNAYADNIYYSDPDRANLYLAGGGKFWF
jgi:hypothetical protein